MDESIDDRSSVTVGLAQQRSLSNNSKKPRTLADSCKKCQSLREKNFGRFASDRSRNNSLTNNNNNSEVSPSVCNCSKVSLKFTLTDDKRITVNEVKSKGTKRNSSVAQNPVSRETQSRALVSKVAKYYESYVTEMKLQKYFVNDVIVTSIVPIHWKDPKCKGARWIVVGYVCVNQQFDRFDSNDLRFIFPARKFHRERRFPIVVKMSS